jgi:membrane fusion protein (multidrug efflux system)
LERAEINLSYAAIRMPIAGDAGAASVDVGNLVGPDSGVLTTIVNADPIRVEFAISERELLNYRARKQEGTAQAYTPRMRLANSRMFKDPGGITFVDNKVDPRTGTIKVRAEFPNPDGLVTPGQFVQIVLSASEPRDALVVPQSAVQANQAGAFVLVVGAEDKVEARPVTLGDRDGASVVVAEGLRAGEMVIVAGLQKVRPGATVKPVRASGSVPGTSGY